ncbi:MAG TPA: nucleotidyl transferase AbiEii/AbiGii toxin family protein [Candidatus Limnocylindrales bacterium]
MTERGSYASPGTFRRALTDRLKDLAMQSRWSLPQLQRQMAYDRLLERLYVVDDGWIVKGATALLARDIGVRGTIDVDVYRAAEREVVEEDLRTAAATDLGDWFRFELAPRQVLSGGVRYPVNAYIGPTVWASFHVDLVGSDLRMTGEPEDVPPLARVVMPNVEQHGYKAYPLVDHVADKVCAMYESYGPTGMPSTRYKDLVDLVAMVLAVSVPADAQLTALRSESGRRGLRLPTTVTVPDRTLWEPGYAAEARRSLLPVALTLDDALAIVGPFLHPLLAGTAAGRWDARASQWVP